MVIMQLEDYGFCGIGEGGAFVADGNIRWPNGSLPVNTHGGNLSEAYIIGMTHVKEAVEQIRGTAVNQVEGAEVALVDRRTRVDPHERTAAQERPVSTPRGVLPPDVIALTPNVFTEPFWNATAEHRLVASPLHELRDLPVAAVAVLLRVPQTGCGVGRARRQGNALFSSPSCATR